MEDSFHALVTCDHAARLWNRMRECWVLPGNSILVNSGDDWLLNVLAACFEVERNNVLMLTWRVWQLRSDAVHGKEIATIEASASFLESYMQSLTQTKYYSGDEIIKGKMPVRGPILCRPGREQPATAWPAPVDNRLALSVDGSYSPTDGAASAGMILRRNDGSVVFAAYRYIFNCLCFGGGDSRTNAALRGFYCCSVRLF